MDYLKSAVNFILGIDDADEPQRVNMKDDDGMLTKNSKPCN